MECMFLQTNTYQAIVVSDTIHTTMIFTYICGGMQWSAVGSSRHGAVVGYSAGGTKYFNYWLSGYKSIAESISCATRLGKRTGLDNTIRLDVDNTISQCLEMNSFDETRYRDAPQTWKSLVEPCPCTRSQANRDTARFQLVDGTSCYVTMKPVIASTNDPLTTTTVTLYQQCCYDNQRYV